MAHSEFYSSPRPPLVRYASSNMAHCSPAKIYGARAADQTPAGTLNTPGFNSFEFASPAKNATASWSQPVNVSVSDISHPTLYNEEPWSSLRTRGERTLSCDASMTQVGYMPSTALSDSGTLVSRHAVSDSAYVSGTGSRLSNNLLNSTRSKVDKVVKNVPQERLPYACTWKGCTKRFKCRSDHRCVLPLLVERY
jgi:hypothetical protein